MNKKDGGLVSPQHACGKQECKFWEPKVEKVENVEHRSTCETCEHRYFLHGISHCAI
jgi:hypothetical protein